MKKEEHLALLKKAIAANLRARIEHDVAANLRARIEHDARKETGAAELEFIGDLDRLDLDEIIADPIRKALRKQLHALGERLFRLLGNTAGMLDVAEQISDMKPGSWQRRIDIFSKAWDGIGEGDDRWYA
jgi:hypothetical protein